MWPMADPLDLSARPTPFRGEDTSDDVHVTPTYGREHECSSRCWCMPECDWTSPSGSHVYVHRDMN